MRHPARFTAAELTFLQNALMTEVEGLTDLDTIKLAETVQKKLHRLSDREAAKEYAAQRASDKYRAEHGL